ncbi:MAG TPA: hypothetical protein VGB35_05620 [Gammaproteobacteria bacterium]|jgi:hypothetical protein
MTIDITKLSSKELFELAKQKEKEEQEAGRRAERLAEAKQQLAQLVAKHQEALAASDRAIRELQEKRSRMVAEFEAALAPLELDIQQLERQIGEGRAGAESAETGLSDEEELRLHFEEQAGAESSAPETRAAHEKEQSEELLAKIRHIMRTRNYISESLLKEQLKLNGFDMSKLKKEMEKLLREGKLKKEGAGNYALGKKL